MPIKTKRVCAGLYTGKYNDIDFSLHKVEQVDARSKNQWYWKIGSTSGEDWYPSKNIALLGVKEFIDDK